MPPLLIFAIASKVLGALLWLFTLRHALAATLFFVPDPFVLYALFFPSAQGLCRVYTYFATQRRAVWLTIDDGPDIDDTPQILDLLDRYGARATFFVVGERAARWPHLVEEIVRRGHEIGHHTLTHPTGTFWCATPRRLAAEIDAAIAVLARIGVQPRLFRAPVGIKHLLLAPALARHNLRYVGWTIRSGDCRSRSPEELAADISWRLEPGAIILLHEGPSVPEPVRIRGLAHLLETIAARDLVCEIPDVDQLR